MGLLGGIIHAIESPFKAAVDTVEDAAKAVEDFGKAAIQLAELHPKRAAKLALEGGDAALAAGESAGEVAAETG